MFAGLDDIDWHQLEHAYGPADDVPGWLRSLASQENESNALTHLSLSLCHQGTVYSASAFAVPYLIQRPTVIKTALGYDTIRDYLVLPLSDDGTVVDRLLVLNDSRARERATSSAIVFFPLEGDVGRYERSIAAMVGDAASIPPLSPHRDGIALT